MWNQPVIEEESVSFLSPANPKVLVGRTIQITSMVSYFAVALSTDDARSILNPARITWFLLMIAGLVFILIGKHEERKQKLQAGPTGEVSLRPH